MNLVTAKSCEDRKVYFAILGSVLGHVLPPPDISSAIANRSKYYQNQNLDTGRRRQSYLAIVLSNGEAIFLVVRLLLIFFYLTSTAQFNYQLVS